MGRLVRYISLAFAVLPLAQGSMAAQEPAPVGQIRSATSTLTITTRLVVLDVVVTDKQGTPVDNLTKADFTITEDNAPQPIRSLEAPGQHALPPGDLVHSTADLAKIGSAPVTILVLDELNTRFEDNAFSRYALQKFLKAQPPVMPPTTLLVANDKSFAVLQDYTQSLPALEAALKHDPAEYPWRMARNGDSGPDAVVRLGQTLDSLEEIAQAAAGTPGRKNIVWVGKGFPSVDLTGMDPDAANQLKSAIRRCIDLLLSSRVTLYIVDPTPLSSATFDTETPSDLATLEDETGEEPFDNAVRFSTLASTTGGRAFSARNDLDHEIAASIREGSAYYTLSYSPGSTSTESSVYRRVRVTVDRPGLTVATRDGYYPRPDTGDVASHSPEEVKKESGEQVLDVANAVLSKMVYNGLKVRAGEIAPGHFSLAVANSSLSWQPSASSEPEGSSVAVVSVVAVCFGAKGKVLLHVIQEKKFTTKLVHPSPGSEEIFSMPLTRPAGTTRVRFVLRDAVTGNLGTADIHEP